MDMVNKGAVYVQGGIKKKFTIQRLDTTRVLQPYSPTPVDNGANPFILDGRSASTIKINAYREFNPRDLEENFVAPMLPKALLDAKVPNDLETRMIYSFMGRAAEQFELMMGVGSTSYASLGESDDRFQISFFDGFVKQWISDSAVNRATISQVAITNSTIDDVLDNLLTRLSTVKPGMLKYLDSGELAFLVSPGDADLYRQYITTVQTFKGNDLTSSTTPPWKGVPIKVCNAMPKDTVALGRFIPRPESNLYLLLNDASDFQLKIDRVQSNSDMWFMKGEFKMNILYGWSDEIFLYSTKTASDFIVS